MKRLIQEITLWTTNGNVDTSTYPVYVTVGAAFLYTMFAITLAGGGVYTLYRAAAFFGEVKHTASVTDTEPENPQEEPDDIGSVGGAAQFVFTSSWKPKDDNSIINEDGSLSLKEGETSSIYQYTEKVPARSSYGLRFVSRGIFGPNVVIGRPTFYEVTVGDRSDKVVTLKATDKIEGTLLPVEEAGWAKYKEDDNALRPRTENCFFTPGEEVKVDIVESFIESTSQFKVDVTVTCNDKKSDTFSWIFTPPPKWIENEGVYFAILDDVEGTNSTKLDFLEPILVESPDTN